jgi:hypothetical protein
MYSPFFSFFSAIGPSSQTVTTLFKKPWPEDLSITAGRNDIQHNDIELNDI